MPLECAAGTVVTVTPPTIRDAPNRTSCDFDGSPPEAFSLAEKNFGISLPVTIIASFANAISTTLVFGTVTTEKSGLPHVPAFGADRRRSPT